MNIFDIARMPVSVGYSEIYSGPGGVHESCLQSYQLLHKLLNWLERGMPPELAVELAREILDEQVDKNPEGYHQDEEGLP